MLTADDNKKLRDVTDYWFHQLTPVDWFRQSDDVDQNIRDKFLTTYDDFKAKDLSEMDLTGEQILAAILLFDQMPRNMFRDSAQAFATDDLALSLCQMALANRHDLEMTDIEKSFTYLPLEHSESLKDQELCVSLFQQRTKLEEQIDYAVRHYNVIKRFDRFPHRNDVLGRSSTAEEVEFLSSGGDNFSAAQED